MPMARQRVTASIFPTASLRQRWLRLGGAFLAGIFVLYAAAGSMGLPLAPALLALLPWLAALAWLILPTLRWLPAGEPRRAAFAWIAWIAGGVAALSSSASAATGWLGVALACFALWGAIFLPSTAWLWIHLVAGLDVFLLEFLLGKGDSIWLLGAVYGLGLPLALAERRHVFIRRWRPIRWEAGSARSLEVVVPTLNERANLPGCVESLRAGGIEPSSIIVADAQSPDGTAGIARELGCRVVETSEPGRGNQIAAGAEAAQADIVLVLHADCRVLPGAVEAIQEALRAHPCSAGGALGQRFGSTGAKLLVIEMLNAFRAEVFRESFGDQGQFFRRRALAAIGGYPAQPLMEDVELSARLNRLGPTLYLGGGVLSSARRWHRAHWLGRLVHVFWLVWQYRLGKAIDPDIAAKLYARYYHKSASSSRR